jgi:hypothetical protein
MKFKSLLVTVVFATVLTTATVAGAGITKAAAAKQYLSDVSTFQKGVASFVAAANKWTNSTTNATAYHDALPAIAALLSFQRSLLRQSWPTNARADVRALYSDVSPLVGDLRGLRTLNLATASSWSAQFSRDGSIVQGASNLVRHDLGLKAAGN